MSNQESAAGQREWINLVLHMRGLSVTPAPVQMRERRRAPPNGSVSCLCAELAPSVDGGISPVGRTSWPPGDPRRTIRRCNAVGFSTKSNPAAPGGSGAGGGARPTLLLSVTRFLELLVTRVWLSRTSDGSYTTALSHGFLSRPAIGMGTSTYSLTAHPTLPQTMPSWLCLAI